MPPLTEPAGDGVEPCGRIRAPLELVPLPESLQQRVLDQVLRLVCASAHPDGNTKEARSHAFRDIREGKVARLSLSHAPTGQPDSIDRNDLVRIRSHVLHGDSLLDSVGITVRGVSMVAGPVYGG